MSKRFNSFKYTYITAAAPTTTQVKGSDAILKRICVNTPVSTGVITIYDNIGSDTTTPVAIITSTADMKPYFIDFDIRMLTGLKIVTSVAAQNITVVSE